MAFDVWPTKLAAKQLDELRGAAREAAKQRRRQLEAEGCRAARWRLCGPTVDRLCEVYLSGDWRMIVGFPAQDEVCVICVGQHDSSSATNIYNVVYQLLGVDPPTGRIRLECCPSRHEPLVDAEVVDQLVAAAKQLVSGSKRRARPTLR